MKLWYEVQVKSECEWGEVACFETLEKAQEEAEKWIKETGKPITTNWIRIVKCERISLQNRKSQIKS